MGIRTNNGFMANMAKQLELAIGNSGNPYVETYLDSMDCSVQVELAQLRELQASIARHPDTEHSVNTVLRKWLYGWKEADTCLACLGLRVSEQWAAGYYKSFRA
ncbi:hypothetical protein ACI77O_12205 [Pseudomonas tritici]|uniref:hypothetical protein n=1 Tax=Pseudomonas tritici TaxID=2745518 RepID=UPI00387ADA1C